MDSTDSPKATKPSKVWDDQELSSLREKFLPGTPERSSTVVGLSLELGTTIINHVVIGTSALAHSNKVRVGTDGTLERGHVIVSVDGCDVDSRNIAEVFASGPVGSKVLVRARNESGKEYEVELVRQFAPFVENVVKIEDILNLMNRDTGNASTSGISKAHCVELQAQIECLAKTASIHEQKMAEQTRRLNSYVERLESELLGRQVVGGNEQWASNTALRRSDPELKMATKKIQELTKRLCDYDARGAELAETKRKANALLTEKDGQLTAARNRIEVLEKEVSEHLAAAKALRERISSLEHNKVLLARETQAAQSAKLQEEKSRASLEQSFWRVGSLEKENATLSRELTAVKKDKEKIEETLAAIKAELSDVRRKANTLLGQKADELLVLKSSLDRAEKEAARFKIECKNLEARVMSLEKENSVLNDDIKKLQSEHSTCAEEKKFMQSRIDGLVNDTAKSEMQRGDRISSLETALEIQQSARDLLTAEMKELQAALDRSTNQAQESNNAIREMEIKARREKDQAALELAEIKRKANALLSQQAEELARVRKRAEELERELNLTKAKYSDAETRFDSYKKENGNLLRENGTLKQEKSSFMKEKGQLVTRVAGLEIAVTKSNEKMKLLEKTIDALKASQASTARELQESRAQNEKTLASASVRQNELQTSLENSLKQVREAAAKEKERATSLENECRICASELAETKRKANALLSKQCEELTALRNAVHQKQTELASSKSECAALQGRVAGLVAEREQLLKEVARAKRDWEACEKLRKEVEAEQARLQQQCNELKRSNVSLAEQVQSMRSGSSADIVFVGADKRRADASNFKGAQNGAENRSDAKLLMIRIEALQNQNKSLESDKRKLVEDISQLQEAAGSRQSAVPARRDRSIGSEDDAEELDTVEEVLPTSQFEIVDKLQGQLLEAQLARDNAFQMLDTTITEALAQQIAAEKSVQDLKGMIAEKERALEECLHAKEDVEKLNKGYLETKERLNNEIAQLSTAAEDARAQSAAHLIQIDELRTIISARDKAIEENDYNLELFRARYRDLEETLTSSVLTIQEKESQIRALSSNLRDTQARLEQDIDAAKADALKKTGELKQAESRLLDLEQEHDEVVAKCRRLEVQLHDLSEILVESQQRWEKEIMEANEKLQALEVRCCKAEEEAVLGGKSSKDAEAEIRKLQRQIIDLEQLKQLSLSKEEILDQQIRTQEQTISRLEDVEKEELPQVVAKCRNLEQQNQELSEILLDSQRRWESELSAANLKIAALETQRTEAEKSVAVSNKTINELQRNVHTLRNKVSELERNLELSASRESSNLNRIQEQDESITKLLHIEKKRLQTIMEQRASLKALEENSLVLKNEIRELKIHLELAQARDDSHMQNMEELKQLGQEREQAAWLECENEIHSLREQVRNAQLQLEQVRKENSGLKSEVCSFRKERAPWPNAIAAISCNKSKGEGRRTIAGPIREVDKLRMQLDAVEKLAAERTEQVRTLEMELGYLDEDQGALSAADEPAQRFSERPPAASHKGARRPPDADHTLASSNGLAGAAALVSVPQPGGVSRQSWRGTGR